MNHCYISYKSLRCSPIFPLLFGFLLLAGCDSTDPEEDNFPDPELTRVEDLAADPFTSFGPDGRPAGTGNFTFYSLRDNDVVATSDSASTMWDVAFRGSDILVNGGSSGPGNGAAQLLDGLFEEILEAPEDGWVQDSETGPAIPFGSGNGWYNYNPATMVLSPFPGRVLLIRTADGRYAKMRIVSYYRGAPDAPTQDSEARYITFEYVIQQDGSRSFE